MTRAEQIRSAPLVSAKTNAQVLNEAAAAELAARRGEGEPPAREAGKSALGTSSQFNSYYGEGGGAVESPTAVRHQRQSVREGSRLAVGDSFTEEAEKMRHVVKVVPRSRFGLSSRQMTAEYAGSKGQEHTAFIEQLEAFRQAPEGSDRFNALWKSGTDAERGAYTAFVNKGGR